MEWRPLGGKRAHTTTYDANDNILLDFYEERLNGQWVNSARYTYTYDVNGRQTFLLDEELSNGQLVNSLRETLTYDVQGNLTSLWHYSWIDLSWTPADLQNGDGSSYAFVVTDSAGNYNTYQGYNFTFTYKTIVTGDASPIADLPATYSLWQNYPNPFNPSSTIKFELPRTSLVDLSVFDILGRRVSVLVNDRRDAGVYEVKFDGSNLASAVYFYRLQARDFTQTKRLLLLK